MLFVQSDVPEVSELCWLLMTGTPMGLLERCHAYKDKKAKGLPADAGLFTYPVLMAADILAYDADTVPVGEDQVQHIEVCRDLAASFNHHFGQTFVMPKAKMLDASAKVPGTDGEKMSKSYNNTLEVFEDPKAERKKIMRITTDSRPMDQPKEPETDHLFQLYSLVATDAEREAMAALYRRGGFGYGEVKKALADAAERFFGPARERRAELAADPERDPRDSGRRRRAGPPQGRRGARTGQSRVWPRRRRLERRAVAVQSTSRTRDGAQSSQSTPIAACSSRWRLCSRSSAALADRMAGVFDLACRRGAGGAVSDRRRAGRGRRLPGGDLSRTEFVAARSWRAASLGLVLGMLGRRHRGLLGLSRHLGEYAEKQRGDRLAAMVQATTDQWKPMPFSDYLAAVVRRDPVWWIDRRGVDRAGRGRGGRRDAARAIDCGIGESGEFERFGLSFPAQLALARRPAFGYNPPPLASQFRRKTRLAGTRHAEAPKDGRCPPRSTTQTPSMEAPAVDKLIVIGVDTRLAVGLAQALKDRCDVLGISFSPTVEGDDFPARPVRRGDGQRLAAAIEEAEPDCLIYAGSLVGFELGFAGQRPGLAAGAGDGRKPGGGRPAIERQIDRAFQRRGLRRSQDVPRRNGADHVDPSGRRSGFAVGADHWSPAARWWRERTPMAGRRPEPQPGLVERIADALRGGQPAPVDGQRFATPIFAADLAPTFARVQPSAI